MRAVPLAAGDQNERNGPPTKLSDSKRSIASRRLTNSSATGNRLTISETSTSQRCEGTTSRRPSPFSHGHTLPSYDEQVNRSIHYVSTFDRRVRHYSSQLPVLNH